MLRMVRGVIVGILLMIGAGSALATDTVIILPFENRSQLAEYNWIRESFSILIEEILDAPGFYVISSDERNIAYERLNLSPDDILTRAAMIRLADAAQSNLALIGEFDVAVDNDQVTIAVTARLIETKEGRLVGNRVFNFSGPLSDLQSMQGQLAWNILYFRNPSSPYSKEQMVRRATSTPPLAYESFVKGVQTRDLNLREGFLKRAIQEHEMAGTPGRYTRALFELGLLYYRQADFEEAVKQLKQLQKDDSNYREGLFYLGLAAYEAGQVDESTSAFRTLADQLPMLEVWNNAGAALTARGDLAAALPLLKRATANNPNDTDYRFNYGYASMLNKNCQEAVSYFDAVLKINPRDGEAHFLRSRCLTELGQPEEAARSDNEAKRYLESYAKWTISPANIPKLMRFKTEVNRAAFYSLERKQQMQQDGTRGLPSARQISLRQSLDRARELINQKNDVEAMTELESVLSSEPTNAEAHFLRGLILNQRRDIDGSIAAFKAAVSWNPRLIEGHINLCRLYLARGDRALALAHARQALEIDPQNRDAIALKQQIETGR
ncbi:MAG: tetratricopeptide repeat protein [Acidobacteria bacterium]|nr:tetratricopeptide repeat protein [Acidobacteriota bacterium]